MGVGLYLEHYDGVPRVTVDIYRRGYICGNWCKIPDVLELVETLVAAVISPPVRHPFEIPDIAELHHWAVDTIRQLILWAQQEGLC